MTSQGALLVAAIDFGTTYSGYAFSFNNEFAKDPTKVNVNYWNSGIHNLSSFKTPTCLLLRPDRQIEAFGYEAETKYSDLALDNAHEKWYFFRRFKLLLHENKELNMLTVLEDDTGKSLPAIHVFGLSIKFLKNHLLETLARQKTGIVLSDIRWVLTVPAIWDESAKLFMRNAALQAGIPGDQLLIALEPEAASLFCQHLPVEKLSGPGGPKMSVTKAGTRYMVVDLGGGTVDITVHEKQIGGTLKELYQATGGTWGGIAVDNSFNQLLVRIMGAPVLARFSKSQKADHIALGQDVEAVKRHVTVSTSGKVNLRIPVSLDEVCRDMLDENIASVLSQPNCPFKKKVESRNGMIRIDAGIVKSFFKDAVDNIVEHIRDILSKPEVTGVSIILLVGGFADSLLVQESIKEEFEDGTVRVLIPHDAGLAILKGAVIYGHVPEAIKSRVMRYTYGVQTSTSFDPKQHPAQTKVIGDGKPRCNVIFSTFITIGTSVEVGHVVEESYVTRSPYQKACLINVFASKSKTPIFVIEPGCNAVGRPLRVTIPDPTRRKRTIKVEYVFGKTELGVTAVDVRSGKACHVSFKI